MSWAFGVPASLVDTHIHRLAVRWGVSDGVSVENVEADLKATFAREYWSRLYLQISSFGRECCPAMGHEPAGCPICSFASVLEKARRPAKHTLTVEGRWGLKSVMNSCGAPELSAPTSYL